MHFNCSAKSGDNIPPCSVSLEHKMMNFFFVKYWIACQCAFRSVFLAGTV